MPVRRGGGETVSHSGGKGDDSDEDDGGAGERGRWRLPSGKGELARPDGGEDLDDDHE